MVPNQPAVPTQQTPIENTTDMPKYAFATSMAAILIFTALCWLPGILCLVPAAAMSILVSSAYICAYTHTFHPFPCPQALSKKEERKIKEAKEMSIISFILVLIFAISYPILVLVVLLSTVLSYCRPYPSSSYGYYYSYSRC